MYGVGKYDFEYVVLNRIESYNIFLYYLGHSFKVGEPFNSPLRTDKNPSFAVFQASNGNLLYKDFATGEVGDAVTFVKLKYKISRREAILIIYFDFVLSKKSFELNNKPKIVYKTRSKTIGVKSTVFTKQDINYWKEYGISIETLSRYNVIPVSAVFVDNKLIFNKTKDQPIFAYLVGDKIKIYRPNSLSKKDKWIGNTLSSSVLGLEQLKDKDDLLIITKSLKDIMVLDELGFSSISPNSETILLDKNIIEDLYKRFTSIITLFDNDETGMSLARKYKECYNIDSILLPLDLNAKDISDFFKIYKYQKTIKLLKYLIANVSITNTL